MPYVQPVKVSLSEQKRLKEVLEGIKLAKKSCQQRKELDEPSELSLQETDPTSTEDIDGNSLQCLTCKCTLAERSEQTIHYKSDWHRYNLKLRLLGQSIISEEEFGDAADEVLSISGSDSDDNITGISFSSDDNRKLSVSLLKADNEDSEHDEQFDNRKPKIYFRNTNSDIVSVYKKVLYSRQNSDVDAEISDMALHTLSTAHSQFWTVILLSAGHFAAAVFDGANVAAHKTFHRYVVRAKRGTVQSINDSSKSGSTAKSAGASLRRHNEIALEENIVALLKSWKEEYLDKSSHIFIRIPHYRKALFYGGKESIFEQKDFRIRSIPFVTRRPTFNEVQRVHQELFSVTLHGEQSMTDILSASRPSSEESKNNLSVKEKEPLKEKKQKGKIKLLKTEAKRVESSDTEYEMRIQKEAVNTAALQQFQVSCNNNNKKKKRKKQEKDNNSDPIEKENKDAPIVTQMNKASAHPLDHLSSEHREVMNKLYTACKTSNFKMLEDSLQCVKEKPTAPNNDATVKLEDLKDSVEKLDVNSDHKRHQQDTTTIDSHIFASLLTLPMDSSGNTLLHIATKAGNKKIIYELLKCGADPAIKNLSSFLPYCISPNKEARNTFRRFRADFPDRYNYTKAQIPSPLTEEREAEMKKKQNDKKKAQKAAKKDRDRKMKEEEEQKNQEEDEKNRFLALSDREKRLIAVERRMQDQPSIQISNSRRCYLCAESLFAKVPFEYLHYNFCSMKCLKGHKASAKT
ncbi:unnamed protein product [Clavelina lepadiformis]|uniref:VLRF1 domain-containing protein n=1 Tax=Clavelina lepadiformis TaxID=159417 RepID=A0ABP0EXY4_CLALP